jgi:hypothetical protein
LHTIHLNQIQMDEMELEETGCLPWHWREREPILIHVVLLYERFCHAKRDGRR